MLSWTIKRSHHNLRHAKHWNQAFNANKSRHFADIFPLPSRRTPRQTGSDAHHQLCVVLRHGDDNDQAVHEKRNHLKGSLNFRINLDELSLNIIIISDALTPRQQLRELSQNICSSLLPSFRSRRRVKNHRKVAPETLPGICKIAKLFHRRREGSEIAEVIISLIMQHYLRLSVVLWLKI